MSNNITEKNIKIFKNKIFKEIVKKNNSSVKAPFNFKIFLEGKYNKINTIPLIPTVYFNNSIYDNIGAEVINNYYSIKYKLRELRNIKKYILVILELSKDEINKKTISFNKYKLKKDNLIIDFKEKLSDTIENQINFRGFKINYCLEKYNYLKNIKVSTPLFFTIFQNEYLGSNKSFFLNLFRKYIEIRNKLLKYIDSNNLQSLMAFDKPFFDLKNKLNMKVTKESTKENNKNNKNNNIKYNDYLIYGNKKNNNKNANSNNTKSMYNKVHKFNLLYTPSINDNLYKESHVSKINKVYSHVYDNINKLLDTSNNDLLSITINNIECDFSMIEFLYYYVEPKLFNGAIENNTKMKKYIYDEINKFELYCEDYINWYNKIDSERSSFGPSPDENFDFNKFFDSKIKPLDFDNKPYNSLNSALL